MVKEFGKALFQKAQELNKKLYTEEELRKMYDTSCGRISLDLLSNQTENNKRFNDFKNKLNQLKSYPVEVSETNGVFTITKIIK